MPACIVSSWEIVSYHWGHCFALCGQPKRWYRWGDAERLNARLMSKSVEIMKTCCEPQRLSNRALFGAVVTGAMHPALRNPVGGDGVDNSWDA
jgi:hypothetical protein